MFLIHRETSFIQYSVSIFYYRFYIISAISIILFNLDVVFRWEEPFRRRGFFYCMQCAWSEAFTTVELLRDIIPNATSVPFDKELVAFGKYILSYNAEYFLANHSMGTASVLYRQIGFLAR